MTKEVLQQQKSILYDHHWQETGKSNQANDISQCSDPKVDDRVNPASEDPKHQDSIESENRNANIERRQFLEHHLKASPTDLDSYLELAQLYRDENRPADSKRILQHAIQVFPDNPQVHWELEEAILARSLQQYKEVLELAKKIDTPEIHRELERCENDWACRRIDVCEARIERDPSLNDLRLALGEAMLDASRYEEAIHSVEPLLMNDQYSASAFFLQGRCHLEIGNNQNAMSALRAVALRRAVPAPSELRIAALKLLCACAERIGVPMTHDLYQQQLKYAEAEHQESSHSK